jgi:hypothetical protein
MASTMSDPGPLPCAVIPADSSSQANALAQVDGWPFDRSKQRHEWLISEGRASSEKLTVTSITVIAVIKNVPKRDLM